jgi:hypothetical protein
MSLSPGFPQGAPTLAEVLLQRTFARPPQPFVDGEFLEALENADDAPPPSGAVAKAKAGSQTSDSGSGSTPSGGASSGSPATRAPGKTIDVRV